MATIESAEKGFSYSEILRIANLLIRDDEIVNRAEHQRLAVEVAILKAATFPRLRAVEDTGAGLLLHVDPGDHCYNFRCACHQNR